MTWRNATTTTVATIAAPTFIIRRARPSGGGISTAMVPAIASLTVQALLPARTTGVDTVNVRSGGGAIGSSTVRERVWTIVTRPATRREILRADAA